MREGEFFSRIALQHGWPWNEGRFVSPACKKRLNVMRWMKVIYSNYNTNKQISLLYCALCSFALCFSCCHPFLSFFYFSIQEFVLRYFGLCIKCIGRSSSLRNPSTPPRRLLPPARIPQVLFQWQEIHSVFFPPPRACFSPLSSLFCIFLFVR